MSKSFSKIKKKLKNKWITDSVKGRVSYQITKFRKSHDERGVVRILLDGKLVYEMTDLETEFSNYSLWEASGENMLKALSDGYLHTSAFMKVMRNIVQILSWKIYSPKMHSYDYSQFLTDELGNENTKN